MSVATMESSAYAGLGEISQADLPYRSPSIRREPKLSSNHLRTLYQSGTHTEAASQGNLEVTIGVATPVLPLTPPHVEGEEQDDEPSSSDTTRMRSVLVTPVNQLSPPTPDITPPRDQHTRRFLGAQPSMTSTYAESFRTAQEEMGSETESNFSFPVSRQRPTTSQSPLILTPYLNQHKPSPLAQTSWYQSDDQPPSPTWDLPHEEDLPIESKSHIGQQVAEQPFEDSPVLPSGMFPNVVVVEDIPPQSQTRLETKSMTNSPVFRRGPSLRERLEESHNLPRSRSLDKFANIIGWNEAVQAGENKRWSGVSTSTISAIVVEQPQVAKRRGTLRHVGKNDSLRSVSSPLPPPYHLSGYQNSDSLHRLTHKKARLSNRDRESFGSDRSRPLSLNSGLPLRKLEVIKVAVIPERVSSLQESTTDARQRSRTVSLSSVPRRSRRASDNYGTSYSRDRVSTDTGDRGRDRYYPPQVGPFTVPIRSSSLSAPTSRTTSRANSLNSDSIRSARKQAEHELRNTLNRMESDRLATSLHSLAGEVAPAAASRNVTKPPQIEVKAHDFASGVESHPDHDVPNTGEWTDLRPPSAIATLHSAPSFLSASPEINEAKMVSFFPHNNDSIQIIEPFQLADSRAVQLVQQQQSQRTHSDSPFRTPRTAPAPPRSGIVPLIEKSAGSNAQKSHPPRPSQIPTRTDSFARNLMHTVSLKHTRNKKVDQDLDAASHPMWRPRPFWDDADAQRRRLEDRGLETEQQVQDRGLVLNSVGIPQQRNAFTGPIALMHRISNRRRNRKAVVKQSSFTSLHRLRTGRKLYRVPGLGIHLQMMSMKDIQSRMTMKRLRKEEQRREQRREKLRKTIGSNVISTGDSRFPASLV